jgi:predicted nucleotidyltransferase
MKVWSEGVIEEIVKRLVAEFDPEAIYLFGSHAWGEPDEDSDVNLLVVVESSDAPPAKRAQLAHSRLWGVHASIDVLVRTRTEFERYRQVPAALAAQVSKRGIMLYERHRSGQYPSLAYQSET